MTPAVEIASIPSHYAVSSPSCVNSQPSHNLRECKETFNGHLPCPPPCSLRRLVFVKRMRCLAFLLNIWPVRQTGCASLSQALQASAFLKSQRTPESAKAARNMFFGLQRMIASFSKLCQAAICPWQCFGPLCLSIFCINPVHD